MIDFRDLAPAGIENCTVACMATYPGRFPTLDRVVASLAPQVDWLLIYANQTDHLPDSVARVDNVAVAFGDQWAGNLAATGKIFFLDHLHGCQVFTVDDDFIFPPDYVATFAAELDRYAGRVAFCVHGSTIAPGARSYFERGAVYPWRRTLPWHMPVSLAGSGTFAFDQAGLAIRTGDFPRRMMVDLAFSMMARRQEVPILAIARPAMWLDWLEAEGLFERFSAAPTHHTTAMTQVDSWDFDVYAAMIRTVFDEVFGGLSLRTARAARFDPDTARCILDGQVPADWSTTAVTLRRRAQFYRILPDT